MNFKIIILIIIICISYCFKYKQKYKNLFISFRDKPKFSWFKQEAKKRNIIINSDKSYLVNKKNNKKLFFKILYDDYLVIGDNKLVVSRILQINNIPVPTFTSFNCKENDFEQLKIKLKYFNLKYPLVLKPIDGLKGIGVILNIKNFTELKEKILYLKNKKFEHNRITNKRFIIEEYKKGESYRIYMIKDKILGIYCRCRPYIIGNGKHTVFDIISKYNNNKNNFKNGVTFPIKNINIDLIKSQIDIKKVVPKNKKIILSNYANRKDGAISTETKLKNIHPDNIELFKKINKTSGLIVNGIDFLSTDISKSWKTGNGFVNEINCQPSTKNLFMIHNKSKTLIDNFFNILKNDKSLWI